MYITVGTTDKRLLINETKNGISREELLDILCEYQSAIIQSISIKCIVIVCSIPLNFPNITLNIGMGLSWPLRTQVLFCGATDTPVLDF